MDIERFRRNSGQGEHVKIGNDMFYFKPLPLSKLPELMEFSELQDKQDKTKSTLSSEESRRMFEILKEYTIHCFPELKEDNELCDNFLRENIMVIMEKMMILSMPKLGGNISETTKSAIEKMKADVTSQSVQV